MTKEIKIRPVTARFQPNLAAKLMLTPTHRQRLAKWNRLRNHRERIGHPLKWFGNLAAQNEINALRRRVWELENRALNDALRAATLSIAGMAKCLEKREGGSDR